MGCDNIPCDEASMLARKEGGDRKNKADIVPDMIGQFKQPQS